jgi:ribonuclease HI
MYFDGSLMKMGSGVGLLFISPLGVHMRYIIRLHFPASNNAAEYEALVTGLRIAVELGVRHLDVRGDSQVVIDQVMKSSSCRDPKMEAYCEEVRCLEDKFHSLELNHIARRYMRPLMNSQKSLPVELQFHRTFSRKISINRSSTSGQTEGSTGRHSTLHLRRKPPRPGLRPSRWKAQPY